ncbi:hypothetical protein ACPCDX_29130 [Streptomyces koyangensis]|uniref:hypothetical protein n=1 Tax=Streptomyces koyangensis TaxID=188770 RepID=UPI003C2EF230
MTAQQPDHTDKDVLLELYGPEDGGWYTTRVYDWIPLCQELRDADIRGYVILRALVIEKFKKPIRKLTLSVLCELIPGPNEKDTSSLTRVRGILAALSKAGLVSTPDGDPIKTSSRAGAAQRVMRIRINDMPHKGYAGWRNVEAKLAFLTGEAGATRAEEDPGRNSDPGTDRDGNADNAGRNSDPAGLNSDPRGSNSDPDPAADLPRRERPLDPSFGTTPQLDPPPARSAPDARRATTGSRGSRVSGSAASGNKSQHEGTTSPTTAGREPDSSRSAVQRTTGSTGPKGGSAASSDKKPITNTQRAQVQAVRDLLPPLLARDLPDETPTNISKKILAALDTDGSRPRTPEQLAAYRINPRWDGYWATQYGDDGFDKPLGVVLALVASQVECGNVRCDDRRDVDSGELCPFCVELKADRRVQRRLEQQDVVRAAECPSEPRGGRSGDVVPPPRPEAASWAPAAPGAWPTVVAPAEDTPVVSTVEIPSPDEVQARTADMRSLLRDRRSRPSRAPF